MAKPDWLPYAATLEAELTRVHRRSLLPVWIFAFIGFLLGGVGLLERHFPQAPVPFVIEAR